MRVLCIYLPQWPIQRLLVADPALDPKRPLVLHARDSRRGQLVTICNTAARKRGVRPGMPLAQATAMSGRECQVVPSDSAADTAALARLAEHCELYGPIVGWETTGESPSVPDRLFLDIAGVAVLFGNESVLVHEALSDLTRLGYTARMAVADTIGAAWARAAFQEPLPVAALRIPTETGDLLAQLGIAQIDQLLRLPRASLPARFDEQLVNRLDQFLGAAPETVIAHRPPPTFVVEQALEYPAERLELVETIVRELIERIASLLAERRQGVVRLVCHLYTPAPFMMRVGLFRPSADPRHLWEVMRLQLRPPGPVVKVSLAAVQTAPLENRQRQLFAGNREEAERQFTLLVDRLSSRLGPEAVVRPELTADPLPERAIEYVSVLEARKRKQRPALSHRPVLLRSPPLLLSAISVVPDGPPMSFQLDGRQNTVIHWWGPERIESGWWRGRSVRRDYYRVEIQTGQHYWLFRRLRDGRWFLHGEFS